MKKMLALMSAVTLLFGIAAMSMAQDKAGNGKTNAKPIPKTQSIVKTVPPTKSGPKSGPHAKPLPPKPRQRAPLATNRTPKTKPTDAKGK